MGSWFIYRNWRLRLKFRLFGPPASRCRRDFGAAEARYSVYRFIDFSIVGASRRLARPGVLIAEQFGGNAFHVAEVLEHVIGACTAKLFHGEVGPGDPHG